eukprot:g10708.t1
MSSLAEVTNRVCDVIETRAEKNLNYGVVLIPDGLLAQIPEMRQLVEEVNAVHYEGTRCIEAETLLKGLVESELSRRKGLGQFNRGTFQCHTHSLLYQARSALPTNFDCNLGYNLGYAAGVLAGSAGTWGGNLGGTGAARTGLLVSVENLTKGAGGKTTLDELTEKPKLVFPESSSVDEWQIAAYPLAHFVSISETNIGTKRTSHQRRDRDQRSANPGPVQFSGPLADAKLFSKSAGKAASELREAERLVAEVKLLASSNCRSEVLDGLTAYLKAALKLMD